ncbi:hypothetical protein NFJ02_01g38720 [Pycnococcus provasolii]
MASASRALHGVGGVGGRSCSRYRGALCFSLPLPTVCFGPRFQARYHSKKNRRSKVSASVYRSRVVPVKFASWLTPSASGRGSDSMADEHLSLVDFRTSSYSSVTHRHPVRNAKKIRAVSNDGPMAGGPQLETFALFAGNIVLIFLPGWTVKACLACTSWEPRLKLILACATAVILGANSTVGLRQSRHGSPLATMMLGWGWFRSPLAAERVVSVVQWALCMAFLVTNLLTGM